MTNLPVLTTRPDHVSLELIKSLVLDSLVSPESKRAYDTAITDFLRWGSESRIESGFTKATVNAYKAHLLSLNKSASTINVRLSAIRKLAAEAADNDLLSTEVAAGIGRVTGVKKAGNRTGNWLTKQQAETFINLPAVSTLKGKRDRALLAIMIGCGLRREETASLSLAHIQLREARWLIVDMIGKGGRQRSVPMPAWAKAAVDVWTGAAGFSSARVFRPVNKWDGIAGVSMTAESIFEIVKTYAGRIGLEDIAPHDLRRTFAKLAHKGRAALEQIQLSLGHASIQTTERYLGVQQDLSDAPCDHLGLKLTSY